MIKPRIFVDNTQLHLLTVVVVTLFFYAGSLDNFFFGDDFIWLNRIKHLQGNWSNIFIIENRYFTPLTYISFYVNYKLFGLNPYWYHLHDVIVHALNGMLIYLLTNLISRNKLTSFIAALVFVTSPSILVTVLWPSARTDLVMVFFALASLIFFIKSNETNHEKTSVALYMLALCAKGTALILPLVMFLLTSNDKSLKRRCSEVLPYIVINAVYVSLLFLSNFLSTNKTIAGHNIVSPTNIVKSLPTLIIPERYLADASMLQMLIFSIMIVVAIIAITIKIKDMTTRIGSALTVFGVLPLLFTRDYTLAGNKADVLALLSSPSNRIYLACVGISLLIAALIKKTMIDNNKAGIRVIFSMLLTLLFINNYIEVHNRNDVWSKGTGNMRRDVYFLSKYADFITSSEVLFLFNFDGSTGFSKALLNAYFDVGNLEVHRFDKMALDELTDIDKSPLNTDYDQDVRKVRLLMRCPGNIKTDTLTNDGNTLLQSILTNYSQLYRCNNKAEADIMRMRQQEEMLKLRSTFNACLQLK